MAFSKRKAEAKAKVKAKAKDKKGIKHNRLQAA